MSDSHRHPLDQILEHAAHHLPAQGPIGVFVHHNTLHAFQHLPFEQAVVEAAGIFGTQPYMSEQLYRNHLERGRILASDIHAVLSREPNAALLPGRLDRRELRRAVLMGPLTPFTPANVEWFLDEGGLVDDAADHALLAACLQRTGQPVAAPAPAGRPADEIVNPYLIRLAAAYIDQGISYWPMPDREKGFYVTVRDLMAQPAALFPEHLAALGHEFRRQRVADLSVHAVIEDCLEALGVPESQWATAIEAELLSLPGWAGIYRMLETQPEISPHLRLPVRLADFLAVRLTLARVAANSLEQQPRPAAATDSREQLTRAAHLLQVAKLLNLAPADLTDTVAAEVAAFHEIERRRLFQLAFEHRHEHTILGPLGRHRVARGLSPEPKRLTAQVFCCLDEREESFRRHLEEVHPTVETFGAAGFFGVAIDYTGMDDANGASYCPVVVKPAHKVREVPRKEDRSAYASRRQRQAAWAAGVHSFFYGSRNLVRGWVSTALLGLFSLFPLTVHVLSPRRFRQLREWMNRAIFPEPRTELTVTHQTIDGLAHGFTVEEKVERVAGMLGPAGLTRVFARLVVILGHGSTSVNNPLESAYDCGACGGRRGGPNARLFAAMANVPEVREGLRAKGIHIPDDTWFVGGYHDTCDDTVDLYDLDRLPESHREDIAAIQQAFETARRRNAHERTRRFESAEFEATDDEALWHVEERAEHLAQPRPECGHATNAVVIVGRRALTRGLFLDRRAFLTSYDPTIDPDDDFLGRLLAAAIPVCGGINLEYYFSYVDNERYGCGTKLPHNVTGLVGVMNGHASDLRTGLPIQMVEIHEPVRVLFVIETTPERLRATLAKDPLLTEFVYNRWVRISTIDPDTGAIHVLRGSTFEPYTQLAPVVPTVPTSRSWYAGKRDHLPIAAIAQVHVS